jgi:hypothetical protein
MGSPDTEAATPAAVASSSAETAGRATRDQTAPLEILAGDLRFDLLRNAAYHNDELFFFSFVHKFTIFLSAIAGTATIGSILIQYPLAAAFAGFLVTFFTTIVLVFDVTGRARLHESLRQRYFTILGDLEAEPISDNLLRKSRAAMTRIYGEEPPMMYGVDAVAWNTARSMTTSEIKKGDLIDINLTQYFLRHIWPFKAETFRRPEMTGNSS